MPTKTVSFTKTMTKNLFGKEMKFYSSTPTIVEYEDGYLLNVRWINYSYNADGSKKEWPQKVMNLNSRYNLDKHFNPISEEVFQPEDLQSFHIGGTYGLEDIRIFKSDQYYYTATSRDMDRGVVAISSGIYNIDLETYDVTNEIILPSFYNVQTNKRHEKNWSFVTYQNKMACVYEWYPLQLTEIDYETHQLNRLVTKPMPAFFKDARGSTPGYRKDNEIWFVLHKRRSLFKNGVFYLEYEDFFAIFDLEMNLLRYSELFRLGNSPIQFCIGLIVREKELILSYSLLDTHSFVSVYNMDSIHTLKWYSSQ